MLINNNYIIKVCNNIDRTCYDLKYYKNNKDNILFEEIFLRILTDTINISKNNKLRSNDLNYDDAYCEFENNLCNVIIKNDKNETKNGHLCIPCVYCIKLQ